MWPRILAYGVICYFITRICNECAAAADDTADIEITLT